MHAPRAAASLMALSTLLSASGAGCATGPLNQGPGEPGVGTQFAYPLPPDHPDGDVRLSYLGVTEEGPAAGTPLKSKQIHYRMEVDNRGKREWRVNTAGQSLSIPGHPDRGPTYIVTERESGLPPVIHIPPGTKKVIELYFALPVVMASASDIPQADLHWSVQTDRSNILAVTTFPGSRQVAEVAYGDRFWPYNTAHPWPGHGPTNWYEGSLGFYGWDHITGTQ